MVRYRHRSCSCEWFRDVRVDFWDDDVIIKTLTFTLAQDANINTINFTPVGPVSSVRVEATSVYSVVNNGFSELQFLGFNQN